MFRKVHAGEPSNLQIRVLDATSTDARSLLAQSDTYMTALYPAASNHLESIEALSQPGVYFIGAYEGDDLAGCGAVKFMHDDSDYGEIKRVFVPAMYRGKGYSKLIMKELEVQLTQAGIATVRLETGIHQPAALALYRGLGYRERGPFGNYRPDPLSVFMEKLL
jgi:putative acetyltransferase